MFKWTLCLFCTLALAENTWWVKWKDRIIKHYKLTDGFISLIDGDDLIDLLNEHNLYNTAFEKEDSGDGIKPIQLGDGEAEPSEGGFSQLTETELEESLNEALGREDYEEATLIRDELNRRKK